MPGGRMKKSMSAAEWEDDLGSDTSSVVSNSDSQHEPGSPTMRSAPTCSAEEVLEAVEGLSAKSGKVQEGACTKLLTVLCRNMRLDCFDNRLEEFFDSVRRIVVTPKNASGLRASACRLASVGLIALDDVPIAVYNELAEAFARIANDPSTPAVVVVSCLTGLLISALLAPHTDADAPAHPNTVLPSLAKFFTINVSKTDCDVVGTAIESFTMLSANGYVAHLKSHKELLARLLARQETEIVVPAAESLALLAEAYSDEADPATVGILKQVEHNIEQLNRDANRANSKIERKNQKAALRRVLAQLSDGDSPEEKLSIGGRAVVFSRWFQILAADVFRSVLGSGFAAHLQQNPKVQLVLGVTDVDFSTKKRTKVDKEMMMADATAAGKERRLARNKQTKQFSSFLADE